MTDTTAVEIRRSGGEASHRGAREVSSNTDPHPVLKFPVGSQLRCFYGRYRNQAAREVLKPRENADYKLKTALIEEYANEKPPSAGEIYCKIHKYKQKRDLYSKGRWRSRLSENDTRYLDQLSRYPDLKAAFDDLLGCKEGNKDVWSRIFRHNKQAMRMLDNATVKAVELTFLKHSKRDAEMLHGRLVNSQIFAAFSLRDREVIWSELSKIAGLITLFFFFLRGYQLPARLRVRALDAIYFGAPEDWDLAYRLLWLYTMQNVTNLPPPSEPPSEETKTKRKRLAKARPGKVDEVVLSNFTALAVRLGFKSDQISALSQRSADREIACAALLNARKSDRYEYTDAILESNVKQIVRLFDTTTSVQVQQVCPAFVSNDLAASGARYGFPSDKAHARDTDALSISNLHAEVTEQGESITSFFMRRSVYFAFFGRPSGTCTDARSHPNPSRDPSFGEVASSPFQQSRSNHALSGRVDGGPEGEAAGREGSALDLENLIAGGLASTSRGPTTEDLGALVRLYRDLIGTDNNSDRQEHHQDPDKQRQRLPAASTMLGQHLEFEFLAGHTLVFHDLHQARRHVRNIRLQSWLNLVWMCYKGMLLRYPKVAEAVPIKTAVPEKFNDHLNVSNQLQAAADINGYSQSR
ncbi:hypothetical protein DL98DRAFT_540001 [Cadophora sp. DSE1049]|nr:hypothetical protein DL98DRAFT_540001 [Cadophora sp. DSE1049]